MVKCLSVSVAAFASVVVAWCALFEFRVGGPLAEGEFNSGALLVICRVVHAGLDGWPVYKVEGGWCPVFTPGYVESKLSVQQ